MEAWHSVPTPLSIPSGGVRPRAKKPQPGVPPRETDVAIVGSGITGLVAGLHLARGGRKVTVLEAREPGHGASTRNAGYVGRTLKHSFGDIMENRGS